MTAPRALRARTALAVAGSVAFALAAHAAIVRGISAPAGALLALVPLAILVLSLARRSAFRLAAIVLLIVGAAVAWRMFPALTVNFPSLFFLEYAGGQLVLAFIFGRTLRKGREPLVTQFARAFHGEMPPEVARYTRGVTIAWTIFFIALFAASCTLYGMGRLHEWSLLANIVSPLLVGTMFIVEYIVRHRMLPDLERAGLFAGVRAFSRHFRPAQSQTGR